MAEKGQVGAKPHHLVLDERRTLTVAGVSDVQSFDEKTVVAVTENMELSIQGSDLQITKLNLDTGDLAVEGRIDSLLYEESRKRKGLLGRLFR